MPCSSPKQRQGMSRRRKSRGQAAKEENHGTKWTRREEGVSRYEELKNKRIKENMERMQNLGLLDLSLKLKNETLPQNRSPIEKKRIKNKLPRCQSPRRSCRLKSLAPIHYCEIRAYKKHGCSEDVKIPEGKKTEAYTEEHEKLLGDCKTSWVLDLDGYGKDGKRICDPVKGEFCHQCRRRTLGHHAHLADANYPKGSFVEIACT